MRQPQPARSRFSPRIGILLLLVLTLAMFADVLFTSDDRVLSQLGRDTFLQDAYWRDFGFGELSRGNLALWNPHVFSGAVFLGGFQSGLLYPLNWHFLLLSLPKAINAGIALHVFLAGLFLFLWARNRGLHPAACTLAGALFMFSGAYFLHVYAGHLGRLNAMVWAPLIFLAVDLVFDKRSAMACLLGVVALAMQFVAGDPQYVYYTVLAAAVYSLMRLYSARQRWLVLSELAIICAGAAALAAVEILTGLGASRESVRAGGVGMQFASEFSLPPENLLTMIAPTFFGNITTMPYWGRCYFWEMVPFIGLVGLVLAMFGATRRQQGRLISIVMVVLLLLLALGKHTPLFSVLYHWLPGFNLFRGTSKFILPLTMFLALWSAVGLDSLLKTPRVAKSLLIAILACAVLFATGGLALHHAALSNPEGRWQHVMQRIQATDESLLQPSDLYQKSDFIQQAGAAAGTSLALAAGVLILMAALLFLKRYSPHMIYGVAILAVAELFVFAHSYRPTFSLSYARVPQVNNYLRDKPGDYRVFLIGKDNATISAGLNDIWGLSPIVLRRYAEFMTFAQGKDPDKASQYLDLAADISPLYRLLRLRYSFFGGAGALRVNETPDALPHVLVASRYILEPNRDKIFAAIAAPDFDPTDTVILEQPPSSATIASIKSKIQLVRRGGNPKSKMDKGWARVVASDTDWLSIDAQLPAPGILLVTDSWSRGWRARPDGSSAQARYEVLPADYTLRAIPLEAGEHHIRMEYSPVEFRIGAWISFVALLGLIGVSGWLLHRARRAPSSASGASPKS